VYDVWTTDLGFCQVSLLVISVNRDLDYLKFSEIRNQKPPPFLKKVFVYGKGVQNASLLIVIIIK
jgi:uncharacterized protein YcsI (UPF0317 family)